MTSPHIWGIVHQAYHQNDETWAHIKRMGYRGATVFKEFYGDDGYVRKLTNNMPFDAFYLARDHALTHQFDDMHRNPSQAGYDHANVYIRQVEHGECLLPLAQTYFMGLNEPDTYTILDEIIPYELAFLDRLAHHPDIPQVPPLRGAALRLSTGHPPTKDRTPNTKADWTVFDEVFDLCVEQEHMVVLNEYGRYDNIYTGDNILRFEHLHRFDIDIIIGEVGIDDYVNRGKPDWPHLGWQHVPGNAEAYALWLNHVHRLYTAFPNVLGAYIFVADFAHPWESFNIFTPQMMEQLEKMDWSWAANRHENYVKWLSKYKENKKPVPVSGIGLDATRADDIKQTLAAMRKSLSKLEKLLRG